MTLREFLEVTDVMASVTVHIKAYGMDFKTTHSPKCYTENQEREKLCEKEIKRIYHTEDGFCVRLKEGD